jgi:hypothetical protein
MVSLVNRSCIVMILLLWSTLIKAQSVIPVQQKMNVIEAYNTARTPEKIFIHTDKQNYSKEDTLWFKAYVFDATMAATSKSGLMYIEIADANNRIVARNMVKLEAGTGAGYVALPELRYPQGTYTLRAYTNWLRNFDEQYVYTRQFAIEGTLDENWMINSRFELTEKEGKDNVKANLAFVKNSGSRMFAEELRVRITEDDKLLHYYKITTGVDGTVEFDFNLRDKINSNKLNLTIIKKTKGDKDVTFNVPVIINRDEKTDLQFMPEGGNLIAGLTNRVGFKAINEEGKGVAVTGAIYNNANQKIAGISTIHKGMGAFEFTPEVNQTYTARINHKGKELTYTLPKANTSGFVMRVDNTTNKDSIIVNLHPTNDLKQGGSYYLIGQSLNVVCYGAMVNLAKDKLRFSAPRSAFPTGVARFTLLSRQNQPVAERVVYINHHDQIRINIKPSKLTYTNRDSVNLDITATDKDGEPVQGDFSIAVTDDGQTLPDTSGDYDMPAKLLLADDLKGYVENPGWYFAKGDSINKIKAFDALMLTQGWVKYDWQDVFAEKQKQLTCMPEPEFIVKGKVTNGFNKDLEKTIVILAGTKPALLLQTETNAAGEFEFTGLTPPDTVVYLIQAKNKRGRAFNVDAKVEEYVPPVFTAGLQRNIPLYVNIDTTRLQALRTKQQYDLEEMKQTGNQLKEVQIKAKKIVKESKVLVEEPDFTLNREDIKQLGKVTLLDMLKKIPGFTVSFPRGPLYPVCRIDGKDIILIIDGMDPGRVASAAGGLKFVDLLNYTYNDDIKGLEVMTSGKNQITYSMKFGPEQFWGVAYVEITTYSGKGITRQIPGSYLYQPPAFAPQKEFYSPRYAVKKDNPEPDTRATIFWAPNVITDKTGKASVGFYTADKSATYTVNIQGADMGGLVGAGQSKIIVKKSP